MKVPALLKNKYVCYALMALAALNIIGYVTVKAWECLALFSLAGYSAHCYCKNVSLAILAALFVANFVFGCGRVKEGFEDAMAGPAEKAAEAATLLREAAGECRKKEGAPEGTNCEANSDSTACADTGDSADAAKCEWIAAQIDNTFSPSKANCCDGNSWKAEGTDFTAANATACQGAATADNKTEQQYCGGP